MKYLDQACKRCGKKMVIPPLVKDLKKQPVLVVCDGCERYSRYNVGSSGHYWLSKWGRSKMPLEYIQKKRSVSFSDAEMTKMRKKGRTPNQLARIGYNVDILDLTNSDNAV